MNQSSAQSKFEAKELFTKEFRRTKATRFIFKNISTTVFVRATLVRDTDSPSWNNLPHEPSTYVRRHANYVEELDPQNSLSTEILYQW